MIVGITYDLRSAYLAEGYGEVETAEFDRDDTIDAIESALVHHGHVAVRIGNVRQLAERLSRGERWDFVFNICEGLHGSARESQVPCLLDAYDIPYTFSDAGVMALSLNKAWTKSALHGVVPTPAFQVVTSERDIAALELAYPLFVKPLSEGTGKGVGATSVVRTPGELAPRCKDLLETFHQPVLVECFLPGREFTVSLVGTGDDARVLGTFEIVLLGAAEADAYGYINKEECEDKVRYDLVTANDPAVARAEAHALAAWRHLGCRDAGRVDLRCDVAGEPNFVEVNPLAGLNPHHSDLPMLATAIGMPYNDLIGEILYSVEQRVRTPVAACCPTAEVA